MATPTYTPIATQTLGSAAASITFSSIPGTYTDLRLVLTCTTSVADSVIVQYNADTATNYSAVLLTGSGTAATSTDTTSATSIRLHNVGQTSTTVPETFSLDVFSYAGATNKTALATSATDTNGAGSVELTCGLWRSTSAITQVTLKLFGGNNFATGTIATLWGI